MAAEHCQACHRPFNKNGCTPASCRRDRPTPVETPSGKSAAVTVGGTDAPPSETVLARSHSPAPKPDPPTSISGAYNLALTGGLESSAGLFEAVDISPRTLIRAEGTDGTSSEPPATPQRERDTTDPAPLPDPAPEEAPTDPAPPPTEVFESGVMRAVEASDDELPEAKKAAG